MRNQKSAKVLAAVAGKVKEPLDFNKASGIIYGGEYPRFRIELAVDEPIIPGFFLQRKGRKPVWIHLKYVRLPAICFHCGKLTHESHLCIEKKGAETGLFGKWLRAEDKSWKIPDWPEESHHRSDFRLVSLPEMEIPSRKISEPSPENKGTQRYINTSSDILAPMITDSKNVTTRVSNGCIQGSDPDHPSDLNGQVQETVLDRLLSDIGCTMDFEIHSLGLETNKAELTLSSVKPVASKLSSLRKGKGILEANM